MKKICQNCQQSFQIAPEDFAFYERIAVPAPTFCPECLLKHKMAWGITFVLNKRKCNAPGHSEELISRFSDKTASPVYDHRYWWSDEWDALSYGREVDFSRPFFEQLRELFMAVPVPNLLIVNSINCDYCPSAQDSKDCYLCVGAFGAQECMYCLTPALSQRCVDSSISIACDSLYDCYGCTKSFNLKYSAQCIDCLDSAFLYDCRNCSDCFGCIGLRSKQYYIFNKPYTKKDYREEMKKINLGSRAVVRDVQKRFNEHILKFPHKFADLKNAPNCTGHDIQNAKNCKNCFSLRDDIENCTNVVLGGRGLKDSHSVWGGGFKSELLYNTGQVVSGQRLMFYAQVRIPHDVQYSYQCFGSSNLFGCAGLRDKKYAILNKVYSKEEYEALISKIKFQMSKMPYTDSRGLTYLYGDFFPFDFSPVAYNESSLQEYFPLTQAQAVEGKFSWHEKESRNYQPTMSHDQIPDDIQSVTDGILKEIIACATNSPDAFESGSRPQASACTSAFRITPQELQFYRAHGIPLPDLCPTCRLFERSRWRLPYKLWHRKCMKPGCQNEFETPYAPDRPEILYCEQCYNTEIL